MCPVFTPPLRTDWSYAEGVREPDNKRFWAHFGLQPRGRSVLKIAGVWTTVDYPTSTQLNATTNIVDPNGYTVQGAFIGGHVYDITSSVAAELIAAGYDVNEDVEIGAYANGYIGGY